MPNSTCFVIMPIGDQEISGVKVEASELKKRYDDLIKEAILQANPSLEVVRADEVSAPGTITSDVITRIMHSDYVLADVTYPNPNVFYELGLRHACRLGTIIVRDKAGPKTPFDIAHLRHYEYENTPSGLKILASSLKSYFTHHLQNPHHPDNQFQELAKLTHYVFPNYTPEKEKGKVEMDLMMSVLQAPELFELLIKSSSSGETNQEELMRAMVNHPEVARGFMKAMAESGKLNLFDQ